MIKETYKKICGLGRDAARKVLKGYYPVLLEYPVKPEVRYGGGNPPHPVLLDMIKDGEDEYIDLLDCIVELKDDLNKIKLHESSGSVEPHWLNGMLPGLDGAVLYGMIRRHKPELYIEIGSGNSTKFARRAMKDEGLNTKIVSFDPEPRAEINAICDASIRDVFENANLSVFKEMRENDVLFIDGSHYSFQNSDVTAVFLDVLPQLPAGAIVEVHDVFLPWDYPAAWSERFFNEQYLLAVWLLSNPDRSKILAPNNYITNNTELSKKLKPLWGEPALNSVEKHGGSFWFQINF